MITKKALENHDSIFEGVKYAPAGGAKEIKEAIERMNINEDELL